MFLIYHTGQKWVNFNQKLEDKIRSGKWQPQILLFFEKGLDLRLESVNFRQFLGYPFSFKVAPSSINGVAFDVHMSVSQTVAMATTSRKDSHCFAVSHLFASLSRVNLSKIS